MPDIRLNTWLTRLLATKDEEAQRDLKEVQQSIHLIQSPARLFLIIQTHRM